MVKALVTGGGGFLGSAVCRALRHKGVAVRSFSRGAYPELEQAGVETVRGDLTDPAAVHAAAAGCDIVFHVAAKAGVWGRGEDFRRVNVEGTRSVLEACRAHGIRRLVYTSSPSVVFDGRDIEGGDESLPYAEHYHAHYPATKAEAERLVLRANGRDIATVSLRPHLIWGPGDNHLVPRIIARRRSGALRRITGPVKKVDSVYIDNAAAAHILAAEKLAPGAPSAGKVYFISNDEPLPVWELIDRILMAAHLPPVEKTVSPGLAYAAGAGLEAVYRLLRLGGEPRMTRFLARELSTAHWFDISAARRDLGYRPAVSIQEGLRRLEAALAADDLAQGAQAL
ncbi:MAG: NAD-dependent epimerase/dehydratase family protein [Elusimicrobiota bacterium]